MFAAPDGGVTLGSNPKKLAPPVPGMQPMIGNRPVLEIPPCAVPTPHTYPSTPETGTQRLVL
jgi:hypothetical protein